MWEFSYECASAAEATELARGVRAQKYNIMVPNGYDRWSWDAKAAGHVVFIAVAEPEPHFQCNARQNTADAVWRTIGTDKHQYAFVLNRLKRVDQNPWP